MRPASIHHMVASQHRPLDPLWKPGVWHEVPLVLPPAADVILTVKARVTHTVLLFGASQPLCPCTGTQATSPFACPLPLFVLRCGSSSEGGGEAEANGAVGGTTGPTDGAEALEDPLSLAAVITDLRAHTVRLVWLSECSASLAVAGG